MTELIFYTNPQSRGRIVHWMLEELGEPYQTEWISYGEQMKSPEYRKINPMGKVPAIKHNGAVVTECPAICTYLALQYPQKKLIPPKDDPQLAAFTRWMFFAAAPVEMAVTTRAMGWEVSAERSATLGFGSYNDVLDALETAIGKGPFICGGQFTAVDVYLGSALIWGMQFGTIDKRAVFEEYTARLLGRSASVRANKINEERIASTQTNK